MLVGILGKTPLPLLRLITYVDPSIISSEHSLCATLSTSTWQKHLAAWTTNNLWYGLLTKLIHVCIYWSASTRLRSRLCIQTTPSSLHWHPCSALPLDLLFPPDWLLWLSSPCPTYLFTSSIHLSHRAWSTTVNMCICPTPSSKTVILVLEMKAFFYNHNRETLIRTRETEGSLRGKICELNIPSNSKHIGSLSSLFSILQDTLTTDHHFFWLPVTFLRQSLPLWHMISYPTLNNSSFFLSLSFSFVLSRLFLHFLCP